jgi:hypothetical protein
VRLQYCSLEKRREELIVQRHLLLITEYCDHPLVLYCLSSPLRSYRLLSFLTPPTLNSILFYFILFYSTPLLAVSGMEGEEEEVDFNEAFKGVEIVDLRE